jgi:hypothetical protein
MESLYSIYLGHPLVFLEMSVGSRTFTALSMTSDFSLKNLSISCDSDTDSCLKIRMFSLDFYAKSKRQVKDKSYVIQNIIY